MTRTREKLIGLCECKNICEETELFDSKTLLFKVVEYDSIFSIQGNGIDYFTDVYQKQFQQAQFNLARWQRDEPLLSEIGMRKELARKEVLEKLDFKIVK